MKQREYVYDNLKFLLIVLVIAGHFADFYTDSLAAARGLYGFIYVFHMPAFVFISGLFSKSALSDRKGALKKAKYFVILYILCKIFLSLPSMVLRRTFDFNLFSESGIPWFMLSMAFWFPATYFLKKFNVLLIMAVNIALACILGYTDVIGDFLCLSKTIVFYPFFLAGYHLDARKLSARTDTSVHRVAGAAGIAVLALIAVLRPDFLYGLRPLLNGRGNAFAQMEYPAFGVFCQLAHPAFGALYRLAHYASAAFMIYCFLAVTPRKKLPVSVYGMRTLQVYFLHYIFIYPLKIIPLVERMRTFLPDAVCVLFIVAASAAVAVILSCSMVTKVFSRFTKAI